MVDCRRHSDPGTVWPVRVTEGAFGANVPSRDLYLSPNHAVCVDDVLIPIKYLINGTTVARTTFNAVTYFHVELAEHDVVVAEGLAVESYLNTDNRALFANGGPAVTLFPDFAVRAWQMKGCAPLVVTGPKLDAVRAMLAARSFQPGRTDNRRRSRAIQTRAE
jgi:Hint domain